MNSLAISLHKFEEQRTDVEPCTGLVYRADVANVVTKRGFMSSIRMNELKRKSCKCSARDYIKDCISDMIDIPILNLEEAEHSKLYTVQIVNERRDWETGHVDDFDLQLTKIKETNE